jgi:hypothetical protein
MQWNKIEGSFEIRITAVKGQARAGTVCPVYLSKATAEASAPPPKVSGSRKWLWITAAVAGGAGVAVIASVLGGKAAGSSAQSGPTVTPTSIGAPSITIGH